MDERKEMEEKNCPICDRAVRSDATVSEFCKLCGMGIPEPNSTGIYFDAHGKVDYFCCDRCSSIYIEKIVENEKGKRQKPGVEPIMEISK